MLKLPVASQSTSYADSSLLRGWLQVVVLRGCVILDKVASFPPSHTSSRLPSCRPPFLASRWCCVRTWPFAWVTTGWLNGGLWWGAWTTAPPFYPILRSSSVCSMPPCSPLTLAHAWWM